MSLSLQRDTPVASLQSLRHSWSVEQASAERELSDALASVERARGRVRWASLRVQQACEAIAGVDAALASVANPQEAATDRSGRTTP